MGAEPLPILLPYGLSSEYQSSVRADTIPPKRHGPLRFRIASLSELLAPSRSHAQILPPLAPSITASAARPHLRIGKSKSAIGSRNNDSRINMAPKHSREQHHRPRKRPKPSTSASKNPKNDSVSGRETRNDLNMRANLHLGDSHDMPITLDGDSSESIISVSSDIRLPSDRGPASPAISVTNLDQSRYEHRNPSAWSHHRSRNVPPPQNVYVSSRFDFRTSPPAHATHSPTSSSSESETPLVHESTARRRESACTTGNELKNFSNISRRCHATDPSKPASKISNSRPTNMRNGRGSGTFSRTKSKTPGPWQYRHLQTKLESRREFPTAPSELKFLSSQGPGKTSEAIGDNQKDMALLDIDDFELRSKVAQLMAVAPALPIIELYHLVIDSEGCMAQAKKRVRAMSEAPYAVHTFTQSTFARSQKIVKDVENDDNGNSEDVKVKIDPGNVIFEWDDDEPALGPGSILKACSRSKLRNKTTGRSRPPLLTGLKSTKISETGSRSTAKRLKVSSSKRSSTRETSSDRDFIVADNVLEYVLESDESHELGITCHTADKKKVSMRRKYSMI